MKKFITAIGIIAMSMSAQAQSNNKSQAWKPWKPEKRSAGIYFKPRMATPVYGLKAVAEGNYFAEVDELSNMGQYIKTTPGALYQVKFAYAHRKSAGDKTLRIAVSGTLAYDIFIDNNTAPGTFSYDSFEFKAEAAETFLGFYVISLSGDPNKGVLIDDVSLTLKDQSENLLADGGFELHAPVVKRTARSNSGSQRINNKTPHMDEWAMLEDEAESFDAATNFQIGLYYYLQSKVPGRAMVHFELAKKGSYEHPDLEFYLARAYHLNHKFGQAVSHYHRYNRQLRDQNGSSSEKSAAVKDYMEECLAGTAILPDSLGLEIKSLGKNVNSNYPDYIPLVSADESTLIFTSRRSNSTGGKVADDGSFYEDIFMATRNASGEWSKPSPIEGLNTKMHDAGIGLSYDGKQLFIYKDGNGGDIYMSKRKGSNWTEPERLEGDVNSVYWEGSASISKDGKYLYFASNRPGGFGGIDIYRSQKLANGKWGKAVNLGPGINTPANEDAPQIHTDDITLFFSSTGHEGMGGYDIFSSVMDASGNWSAPRNVGYPINTAHDDIHFSLNAAGNKAYFNSAYLSVDGQNDIYVMERPQTSAALFLLKGKVAKKDPNQSFQAKVTLINKKTQEVQMANTSDLMNGSYAFNMAFDTEYSLAIESEDYLFNTRDIKVDRQSDLFQYVMNFVVDNNRMYIIEQQDISQVSMNEKDAYAVLAVSR